MPGAAPPPEPKPHLKPEPVPAATNAAQTDDDEIAAMLAGAEWKELPEPPAESNAASAPDEGAWKGSPAHEPALASTTGKAREELQEDLPPRKIEPIEEDEAIEEAEDDEPHKPAPSPRKKGGVLVPLFVGVLILAYLGALGAAFMGMLDPKPAPAMSRDEAMKLLFKGAAKQFEKKAVGKPGGPK